MSGEIDIAGVFVPALLVAGLLAFAVSTVLRRLLATLGAYRFVWHRPLFDTALLVLSLAGIAAGLELLR
jgi:hypothetical protein